MAGDWTKMRTDLYRDPKVCLIADALLDPRSELARFVSQNTQREMTVTRNVTRNATVGALVTVWGVMRLRGKRIGVDLVCAKATLAVLDDMADLPGFGAAMASVGWVEESAEGIVFPNFFDALNVDPEDKKVSSAAERQRRYRERQKANSDVTVDVTRDVTVTHREEKRREEKKEQKTTPGGELFDGVPEQVVHDFKQLRQKLRAPITATAMDGICREAGKAGLTLTAALTMCCERGWRGFKAEWVTGESAATPSTSRPPEKREFVG